MFQFIRKHQAIGLIFIGIVIVSFVIFFSPNQGDGRGGGYGGPVGTIDGEQVGRGDYIAALHEARLAYMFRTGNWPARDSRQWDEGREAANRVFLLREARRAGISVSDDVVAARILDLPFLRDEKTGRFNQAAYDQFLGVIRGEEGMTRTDFENFMRNEVALQHLVQLGGLSGTLVTPREAEARYREGNDRFAAQLVMFSATNHLTEVDLSPASLSQFYSNRLSEYRIPERLQVRYVKFAATNFQSEADGLLDSRTNLTQILDAEYERRGAEAFRDEQGNLLDADAAKAQIRDQYRQSFAIDAARKKANEFANRLYQMDPNADSLSKLAEETGVAAQTSLPFDQFRPPPDMTKVPATFVRQAFALSPDEPFATPVVGEDGVYVMAFDQRIPSSIQPFEVVRDRVVESLRRSQSRALAEAAGRQFLTVATNAIAEGKTLADIAGEAGLTAISLTNFSRTTTSLPELGPRLTVAELLRTADELQPGAVSDFVPAADGGFVLQLTAREPVGDDEVKQELPAFLKQARQYGRYTAFAEWQTKRLAASDVRLPGMGDRSTNAPPVEN